MDRLDLLQWEVRNINQLLSFCQSSAQPEAMLSPETDETLCIVNFPLPDRYSPDHVDLALIVDPFPVEPPKGFYLLKTAENRDVIHALARKFNVFQDTAFHGAPAIEGFEWLCFGYLNGWRYNARAPHAGDNIGKMLQSFWLRLEE